MCFIPAARVSRWGLSAIQRRLRHGIRSAKAAAGISCFSTAGFLRAETKDTYISHARLINSTQTAKPIGLLVINIDVEKLFTIVSANAASVDIAVTNSEGTVILPFSISALSDYFEQTQEPTFRSRAACAISQIAASAISIRKPRRLPAGITSVPCGIPLSSQIEARTSSPV